MLQMIKCLSEKVEVLSANDVQNATAKGLVQKEAIKYVRTGRPTST